MRGRRIIGKHREIGIDIWDWKPQIFEHGHGHGLGFGFWHGEQVEEMVSDQSRGQSFRSV